MRHAAAIRLTTHLAICKYSYIVACTGKGHKTACFNPNCIVWEDPLQAQAWHCDAGRTCTLINPTAKSHADPLNFQSCLSDGTGDKTAAKAESQGQANTVIEAETETETGSSTHHQALNESGAVHPGRCPPAHTQCRGPDEFMGP